MLILDIMISVIICQCDWKNWPRSKRKGIGTIRMPLKIML